MSGFQNIVQINLIVMMFIMHGSWVSVAIRDSCPASPSTVEIVDDCPESEGEWRLAAARKNCSAHASQCDKPDRLLYHCVINAFVNQTLEVCAYRRNIVFGYCAEYSFGANRIQENYKTVCNSFFQNPCPEVYNSTQAYKYPGCYEMTKKTKEPTTETTIPTVDIMRQQNRSRVAITVAIVSLAIIIVLLVGIMFQYKVWKKASSCIQHQREESQEENTSFKELKEEMVNLVEEEMTDTKSKEENTICKEHKEEMLNLVEEEMTDTKSKEENTICKEPKEEMLNLVEEEMTDTIKKHIVPSGQSFVQEETKKVTIVLDENNSDYLLKPEKESVKDCQALLSVLGDGIEKLILMHSEDSNEDNLPDFKDLHNDYDKPEIAVSEDSIELIKEDIATVQSFISEFLKKSKNKRSKIRKEKDYLTSSTY